MRRSAVGAPSASRVAEAPAADRSAAAGAEFTSPAPAAAPPADVAPRQTLRTEFPFELPRGYVDDSGTVHREGVMRLSTARDELVPLRDVRVQENPAYLSVVLLGRVITQLGTLPMVHDGIVENMFASDLAFLQDFYRQINAEGHTRAAVECPHCSEPFEVELGGSRLGES
ncbi:hypothetical protein AB0E75_16590 [Streptomyces griseoviridis]|uniref:Secreted protein n=3 Tax=Streptomyces TaxID=1883 RepID=A0ABT9LFW2_STRGD|nr:MULTISPECIES: hypothetical protein [Streptomyces]MDP9682608.1 hypothetical protein [Streptomyces griseoviridis]GGS59094.1 hypothetical protein GCM10010238_55500 [Streptomyces niveoruber]GGT11777.1 hypothetical protein GCM10010240_51660 [Streptomyces griseoviridis]GGU54472.1 hypothetical protein GCM10010259_52050 [Streptomyces daghestanicus]GHI32221.1 hypothetical protein Sdagh_39510 [Streptomyces daghestanicus]